MPIYEYRCETCEHRLEKLQRMSDGKLVDCPECEQPSLKRLVSASAFRLKGSGWYETDFKKDNKRNLADSSETGSSGTKTAASSAKKTEKTPSESKVKKPESKPAAKSGAA